MYKLLSHNDLDGVGCGILAKLAFGNQADVRYNSISSLDREVAFFLDKADKDKALIITDLSINEENEKRLEAFYQSGGKIQLIDHHKTALAYNNYDWGHVVVEDEDGKLTSATSLLYEFFITKGYLEPSTVVDEFVELVRQYDTWEWERNNNIKAKRLNTLFFLLSIDEFEEKMFNRLQTSETFSFDSFEQKLLEMEERKIERYIRRKKREVVQTKVGGHFAGVVYAESYHSELGNELGKEFPHLDYITILNIGGKRMGFRTIHDNVDVSNVAGIFGGGGHEKASGATLTEEAYKQFVINTFPLAPLREDAKRNRFNVKQASFGTLYKDAENNHYLLYQQADQQWGIDKNYKKLDENFASFEKGETFLKRNYQAWLDRDDAFVDYLIKLVKQPQGS